MRITVVVTFVFNRNLLQFRLFKADASIGHFSASALLQLPKRFRQMYAHRVDRRAFIFYTIQFSQAKIDFTSRFNAQLFSTFGR